MKKENLLVLGSKIRFERMKRNMSQEELAQETGLSRRAISCIECGTNDPKYSTLLAISLAFNISLQELLAFRF